MSWKENAIMYWSSDNGATWNKISDHNRAPLGISVERLESKVRTVDGTLRRYSIAKKRTFQLSWTAFPSKRNHTHNGKTAMSTVDDGWAGEEIESFHNSVDGSFKIKLRKGNDEAKAITDNTLEVVDVMIAEFNKDIEQRGIIDYWSLSITLEEV